MIVRTTLLLAAILLMSSREVSAADDTSVDRTSTSPAKSRYDLPEGGVKELLEFIRDVRAFKPTGPAEVLERKQRAYSAVESALEKIARIATDDDKKLDGFDDAMGQLLVFRTIIFNTGRRAGTAEEKQKLIADIKAAIASSPTPSEHAVSAALKVAHALEYEDDRPRAILVNQEFGQLLAQSTDPATARDGARLLGASRRLDLIGKPLEFSGTLLDGTPVAWNKYRGKVVLVEFWATWCGPCVAEFPNVEKNLAEYRERGFEVLGVSLDEDRAALEKFLVEHPHPWPTVHDGDRLHNPVALHYGLPGPSACILVDREGNVVSIDARGPELGKLLAELFASTPTKKSSDQ